MIAEGKVFALAHHDVGIVGDIAQNPEELETDIIEGHEVMLTKVFITKQVQMNQFT